MLEMFSNIVSLCFLLIFSIVDASVLERFLKYLFCRYIVTVTKITVPSAGIGNFINNIAIPIVLVSTALGIVSKISNKVQIDRLAKRLKSSTIWIIGVILTLFVTLVSVDGTLSSSVDAVTSKTAKAAVSNLIPVVGKILGDAVDSVIGCSSILKNAVGIVGVIIILAISIGPIIKLLLFMAIYYIGAAICEPIADEKVVKLLDTMGDTFKILLGLMFSMSTMIIIGTTLIVKISNSGSIT